MLGGSISASWGLPTAVKGSIDAINTKISDSWSKKQMPGTPIALQNTWSALSRIYDGAGSSVTVDGGIIVTGDKTGNVSAALVSGGKVAVRFCSNNNHAMCGSGYACW